MSNDKPTAIATIKFYPNKHVEVHLSSLKHITPRTLDIASNILLKTYRGMKAKYITEVHVANRAEKKAAEEKAAKDAKDFDDKEAKRLAEATEKALAGVDTTNMPKGEPEPEPTPEPEPELAPEPKVEEKTTEVPNNDEKTDPK